MPERGEAAHLEQLAVEMVLDHSGLTDELTDEEARPLIQWGLAQAAAAAKDVALEPALVAGSGARREETVAERVAVVRRVMKILNDLAADRHGMSPEQVAGEIQYILELAARLPRPPDPVATRIYRADAAHPPGGPPDLANGPFVQEVLNLLEPGPWPPAAARPTTL